MQKVILIFILICFIKPATGQNISVKKNLSSGLTDFFDAISLVDSSVIIKTGSVMRPVCDNEDLSIGHGAMISIDLTGTTSHKIETSNCDSSFFYCFNSNSNLLATTNNNLIAAYADCNGSGQIRLLQFDPKEDTSTIYEFLPDSGYNFNPFDIEFLNDTLYLILKTKDYQYELWQLDENYDVTRKEVLYDRRLSRLNASITPDSTLLLIMSYSTSFFGRNMIIREYDEQLNLLKEFIYDNNVASHGAPTVYKTSDGGYIIGASIDFEERYNRWIRSDTFPLLPTITKLDASFTLEWEFFFIEENSYTEFLSFKQVSDQSFLGVGYSSEFAYVDTLDNYLDNVPGGWAFLITDEGELLWERYITDSRSNRFNGTFWDGCAIPGGYAFAGLIDTLKEEPDPFLNDPAGWLLTLDTNGCWNGNCNDYIIIINDDSSTTLPIDTTTSVFQPPLEQEVSSLEVYPNPTSSMVTLEFDNPASRTVEFLNLKGEVLRRIPTESPKLIFQIGGYPPGIYLFRVFDEQGQLESSKKIVLQ